MAAMMRGLWRGKWTVLLCAVGAGIVTIYFAFAVAGTAYSATATIHLEPRHSFRADQTTVDPAVVNTHAAILRSRHILSGVVTTLDLESDPEFNRYLVPVPAWSLNGARNWLRSMVTGIPMTDPTPDTVTSKTIENLANALTTRIERGTYIISATATTGNADKSQQIANAWVQFYLDDQTTARLSETTTHISQLQQRVSELQQVLRDKETQINAWIAGGQFQSDAELDVLSRQANEAQTRLTDAQNELAAHPENAAQLTPQIRSLSAFHNDLNDQIAQQSAGLVALQQLRRETENTRQIYTQLSTELQQARMQQTMRPPDARLLSPASTGQHAGPRKTLMVLLATVVGGLLGILWVLWRQSRAVQAETIGTVLGIGNATHCNAKVAKADEAINHLRTRMMRVPKSTTGTVILCAGATARDRQGEIALSLAKSIARLDDKTLFIDADTRQATQTAQRLDTIPASPMTLNDYITRDAKHGIDSIHLSHTGTVPADIFLSNEFEQMIQAARSEYNYIVIHAPAATPYADTPILARFSDRILYCLRANKTSITSAQAGQSALNSVHAPTPEIIVT
ncbi:hypothetical protein TW80_07835 [Loktanella sp. S4079]|nr:hypothetical protein TW80_07835 [Loktanella sp. S4079]